MTVTLGTDLFARFPRFSLYNSPYVAHDHGQAVDLYPGENLARSPVSGEVLDVRTVDAPPKPYADDREFLILLSVDGGPISYTGDPPVARFLHVEPSVEPGETVAVGDPLGTLVRSGFFAPWVDNHLHLGFRAPDANPYRASGSLSLALDPALYVRPLRWDGTGTVVETGDTYAVLDSPSHPDPGSSVVGMATDVAEGETAVLDGGLVHYAGGGMLGGADGPVSLLGEQVGTASGRDVTWADVAVSANGTALTGLSLFLARDAFGAKLVCPDHEFAVGEDLTVAIEPTTDPVRLG